MLNFGKNMKSRILACLMAVIMIFTVVAPGSITYAEELIGENSLLFTEGEKGVTVASGGGVTVASGGGITVPGGSKVFQWDVTTLNSTGVTDKDILAEGIYENFFKVVGKVTQRLNSGGTISSIELDKAQAGGIQFTVTGTADVVVEMSSTGSGNNSAVGLIDSNGNLINEKNNTLTVNGTARTKLTYTGLAAGTYKVVSPLDSDNNRGARFYTITVTETVEPKLYQWDVTTLDSTGVVDKDILAEGTYENFFKVVGKVTQRLSSGGTISSIELDKAQAGGIQFTVKIGRAHV